MSDSRGRYIVGVDVGGTFTDCVILDTNGKLTIGKALSTTDDFSRGVVDSLQDGAGDLGLPSVDDLLHSACLFFPRLHGGRQYPHHPERGADAGGGDPLFSPTLF